MEALTLGRGELRLADLLAVSLRHRPVALCPTRRARLLEIRARVEDLLADDAPSAYGINTGFGALAEVRIPNADLARLQTNLIRSHAAGVGAPYDRATTRAMMLLRANVLVLGTSGVRPEVPELLLALLNAGVHPVVPQRGSVGASGDLAPLAHLALVLMGEGEAEWRGARVPAAQALQEAEINPIQLAAKEGLALINGTQAMTADAALVLARARNLTKVADIVGSTSLDALLGSRRPFDPRVHRARPHPGQALVARNLLRLLEGSALNASHQGVACHKVQDPYSLRCMPQVHGATREVVDYAGQVIERELRAATDNPLVFPTEEGLDVISGGNFHGQPLAFAADFLGIGLAELANISERRIEQLVNPHLSSGLPPFLATRSGLNSGFMIAQVTAAALVSENKVLAHPASVDSIPSSANREDHVSMGTIAARKARDICENVERVLAIELLCGGQGVDLRRPLHSSPAVEAAWRLLRTRVAPMDEDRVLYPDMEAATGLVRSGALVEAVEAAVGALE